MQITISNKIWMKTNGLIDFLISCLYLLDCANNNDIKNNVLALICISEFSISYQTMVSTTDFQLFRYLITDFRCLFVSNSR